MSSHDLIVLFRRAGWHFDFCRNIRLFYDMFYGRRESLTVMAAIICGLNTSFWNVVLLILSDTTCEN